MCELSWVYPTLSFIKHVVSLTVTQCDCIRIRGAAMCIIQDNCWRMSIKIHNYNQYCWPLSCMLWLLGSNPDPADRAGFSQYISDSLSWNSHFHTFYHNMCDLTDAECCNHRNKQRKFVDVWRPNYEMDIDVKHELCAFIKMSLMLHTSNKQTLCFFFSFSNYSK